MKGDSLENPVCLMCGDGIGDEFVVLHARKTGFVRLLCVVFCSEACLQSLLERLRREASGRIYDIEEIVVRRVAYSRLHGSLTERIQRVDSFERVTEFPNILYGYFPARREPLSPVQMREAAGQMEKRLSGAPGDEDFQTNLFVWRRAGGFRRRVESI